MRRVGLVVVALLVMGGVTAGSASAYSGVVPPVSSMTSGQKAAVKTRFLQWDALAGDDLTTGMFRAAEAGGVESGGLAGAGAAGLIVPIVAPIATYAVYKVACAAICSFVYRKVAGAGSDTTVGQIVQWRYATPAPQERINFPSHALPPIC